MVVRAENLEGGRHVVQFYGRDEELAERVTGYLLGALGRGGVAIVIATPEPRREFEPRLGQAGVVLAAARDSGSYLTLDAGQTLRQFMAAGQPDRVAFDRVIGAVIRRSAAGGQLVHAFGEMVALLWDEGLVSEAVQLEGMWDELGRRYPFSLFCGYRTDSVTRDIGAFAEGCRLHGESAGSGSGPAQAFAFPREAPGAARHFVVATVNAWGVG